MAVTVASVPMSLRSLRVLAPIAVAGLVAFGIVVMSAASPPSAIAQSPANKALLARCVKAALGLGRHPATPAPGSTSPDVVSRFGVFLRTRSIRDALPAAAHLGSALAATGATSYDPAAAVRLAGNGAHGAVYAVPATVALATEPASCNGLPQFAGVGAYLAEQAQQTGSGPGACLVSTQLEQNGVSGLNLPGATPPKPTKTLAVSQSVCRSEAVLSGYVGAVGDGLQRSGPRLALIPDGVSTITYTLADGRTFTVPVAGNLATLPAALSIQTALPHPTAAEFGQLLAADLPTDVTESGPGASQVADLARPASLIPDAVGSFSFLRSLLTSSTVSSSSGSSSEGASCSARNHRCVVVIVTTNCTNDGHCHTSRTIRRYRYVGSKPPAGTTGPDTQPTAPIVGRANRFVTRPRKLALVLSGTPHRRVVVLLSVNCFAHNAAASGGGPPLRLAVPSRTPIALPGPGRAFHACDVGALVISNQRGPVHVTVTRG